MTLEVSTTLVCAEGNGRLKMLVLGHGSKIARIVSLPTLLPHFEELAKCSAIGQAIERDCIIQTRKRLRVNSDSTYHQAISQAALAITMLALGADCKPGAKKETSFSASQVENLPEQAL